MSTRSDTRLSSESDLAAPPRELRYAALSDIGKRREENQDSYGILEGQVVRAYIVADGMGGVQGGAIASSIAVDTVKKSLEGSPQVGPDEIKGAIERANDEIFSRGSTDPALVGMGTTIVALFFSGDALYVANVGDSRAYLIRANQVGQVTEDHTLVMELVRAGTITPDQAHNHPVAHMLTRSLGPSEEVDIDCRQCTDGPFKGDRFLLCSDGLYNMVTEQEILQCVQSNDLANAVKELVNKANDNGGTDNITVIIVEAGEGFPELKIEEAAEESKPTEIRLEVPIEDEISAPIGLVPGSDEAAGDGHAGYYSGIPEDEQPPETAPDAEASLSGEAAEGVKVEGQSDLFERLQNIQGESRLAVDEEMERQRESLRSSSGPEEAEPEAVSAPPRDLGATLKAIYGRLENRFSTLFAWISVIVGAVIFGFAVGFMRLKPEVPVDTREPELTEPREPEPVTKPVAVLVAPTPTEVAVAASVENDEDDLAPLKKVESIDEQIRRRVNALERKQQALTERLSTIGELLSAFEGPLSGRLGEMLNRASSRREELAHTLDLIKNDLDDNYRALSLWQERRKRLDSVDPLSLATELAAEVPAVRERKTSFEKTTWAYLTEAEKLKYSPDDKAQIEKVADLLAQRKQLLKDLAKAVHRAVLQGIADGDARIAELTARRDEVEAGLKIVQGDIDVCRVLIGSDLVARESKRRALMAEQEQVRNELVELSRVADLESVAMYGASGKKK